MEVLKFLITGSSGFVGTNLINYFSKSFVKIDKLELHQDFEIKENILLWENFDLISFSNYNIIIHLAGKAHDIRNKSTTESYIEINFGLTKKIFDKFLDSKTECFIFFSSVKAVADVVIGDELSEDVTPSPVGPYGESKLMAEEYILSFLMKDDHRLKDKKVYILRPCMIHGPGNKGNLNLLYGLVKKGIPWPLGAFDNKRSFTSVENLCFIIQKIINSDIPSGVYNIADDEPVSTNRLIELISEVLGNKAKIINVNQGIIKGMSRLGDFLHLPLNSLRLQKLTENYVVSNEKIKSALGLDKLPISAEEGLTRTLRNFNE
jgi:nucleoside-diphosphate-sugar epimerase